MLPLVEVWRERLPPVVSQLLSAVLVVGLAFLAYQFLARALRRMRDRGILPPQVIWPLERVLRGVVIVAAILLTLQQFGVLADAWSTMTALVAVIGVGFVATWSILSNSFCAIVLLISRPFQVGDEVEILPESLRGKVVDFNLLFTVLLCDDGSTIQVPNNLFFQKMFRRRRGQVTSGLDEQMSKPAV